MRLRALPVAALLAAASAAVAPPAGAGDAVGTVAEPTGTPCTATDPTTSGGQPVTGDNAVYDALRIGDAADLFEGTGRTPGEGVTVVVVGPRVPASLGEPVPLGASSDSSDPLGAVAASLVGGDPQGDLPIGFAPGARVVAVEVYDVDYDQLLEGAAEPSAARIAAGLSWIHDNRGRLGDHVVALVPDVVERTAGLAGAVRDLDRDGVLVVAGVGDRPLGSDSHSPLRDFAAPEEGDPPPGENARRAAWPAGFGSVLAVGVPPLPAGEEDVTDSVVPNSAVDVAAPTRGGVARGATGEPCVVDVVSSRVAAAEVAGVAALVWSWHRDEDARELRERLVRTAAGSDAPDAVSPVTGHGVVQPLEALQRMDVRGREAGDTTDAATPAQAPGARADLLAGTRRHALWWGLVAGGGLVVAVLLRPVLARRRPR
ncbi:MAG TPA: S8 family serine peptidase [Nocardioides sp.]|nr:S8 family serine peptidase [Nocardioides sp.]